MASNGAPSQGEDSNNGQMDMSMQADGAPPGGNTMTEAQDNLPTSTRSLKDLVHPPKDLAGMRLRLFEVQDKIELQVDEFERYWPYIDNVWVRQHKAGTDRTGRFITDYYACRLQRPTYTPKTDTPRKEGQPTRKKQIREGGTCQMRLKTIRYEGGYSSYTIVRVGDDTHHTHDLDHIDKIKRTSVLMEIAKSEVMKGYMPASVYTVMNEDPENLIAAGGRYLNRNDVRNASQHWRQIHKEELRVHDGYKYDHGNGIVRHDTAALPSTAATNQIVDPALADVSSAAPGTLRFLPCFRPLLDPYLPQTPTQLSPSGFPHVTLTYATSLDSSLTLAPGMQTHLSSPVSKAMTHYLRSKHDAIIIGVGTAVADDPALNCRLEGAGGFGGLGWDGQPRPVIIDPGARWLITPQSKILQAVHAGKGRAPWVIIAPGFQMDPRRLELLKFFGGKYLGLQEYDSKWRLRWEAILMALAAEGITSVMIEGGGMVINDLLQPENAGFINSVVVTVAPTYLGKGGVSVSPAPKHDETGRPHPVVRFQDVRWLPLGEDVVMCGKMPGEPGSAGMLGQAPMAMMPGTSFGNPSA
ncbi:2,5-diamino-6-(ribosylamino)-4(3H)-pyrimidinone 5'-phosphate reductase [Puttea exsequens]|nr:2,5-diamino-6-(ribosylamino)-4(3H)-pyrimidinone 5'-phosphate reductase [Puttea exsequens]